jgi:hypothetical protein
MGTGTKIKVTHIATDRSVEFSNFALTEFSDALTTNWNKQEVYGRMDPIMNYQGTGREISIGISWKSPYTNFMNERHKEITKLMSFQYPTYLETDNALAIQSPPLLRVSFANLISNGIENASSGLVCAMDGCAYTPALGFTPEDSPMVRFGGKRPGYNSDLLKNGANAVVTPKTISLKFKLTILHENSLGWHFNLGDGRGYGWMGPKKGSFGPSFMHPDWAWDRVTTAPGGEEGIREQEPDAKAEDAAADSAAGENK